MRRFERFFTMLLLVVGVMLFSACSTSRSMLSNNYKAQKDFTTHIPYDRVWDNVIDLFAESGITITNMEKASGLIVANGIEFNDHYTVEDKKDKRYNPNAYFVIPNGKFDTAKVSANFNVRVRQNDDNTVTVSINLPNLTATTYKRDIWLGVPTIKNVDVASTGVFEQMLFDVISK